MVDLKRKVAYWIVEGNKYIDPKKQVEWEKECNYYIDGEFRGIPVDTEGKEIDIFLKVLQLLNANKDIEKIKTYLDSLSLDEYVLESILNLILIYTPYGIKIFKKLKTDLTESDLSFINAVEKLNNYLKQGCDFSEAKAKIIEEDKKEHSVGR